MKALRIASERFVSVRNAYIHSDEVAGHRAQGAVVGDELITGVSGRCAGERAGEDDLTGLDGQAVWSEAAGNPGDSVGRVTEYAGGETGLFDYSVAREDGANPSHV